MFINKCLYCDKKFNCDYSKRKYCSYKCYWNSKKKRVKIKCDLCGKEFLRVPFKVKEKNYCSKWCSGKVNRSKRIITPEDKLKISKIAKERGYGRWMKGKKGNAGSFKKGQNKGSKSSNWKGGITPLNNAVRGLTEMFEWKKAVFEKDDWTCQICGVRGGTLNADHYPKMFWQIMAKNKISNIEEALACEELWNINNGRTTCENCHREITKKQMKKYWKNKTGQGGEITKALNTK